MLQTEKGPREETKGLQALLSTVLLHTELFRAKMSPYARLMVVSGFCPCCFTENGVCVQASSHRGFGPLHATELYPCHFLPA